MLLSKPDHIFIEVFFSVKASISAIKYPFPIVSEMIQTISLLLLVLPEILFILRLCIYPQTCPYLVAFLGKKRTGKKRTGNKHTGIKRTGKKRIRKRAHAEKSSRGIKRSRKKAQIQLF